MRRIDKVKTTDDLASTRAALAEARSGHHAQSPAPLLDGLVDGLYEAAAGCVDWSVPLGLIGVALEACAVSLHRIRSHELLARVAWSLPGHGVLGTLPIWHPAFPGADRVRGLAPGAWFNDHELFSAAFVAGNAFYQENVLAHGGRWIAVSKLRTSVADTETLLTLVRSLGRPPFSLDDQALVERACPHLARACDFHALVRDAEAMPVRGQDLFECFGRPMAIVDDQCRIVHLNPAARRLLDAGDPACRIDGRIVLRRDDDDKRLRLAVLRSGLPSAGVTDARRIVNCRRSSDGSIVTVLVMTVGPEMADHGFGERISAVLVFVDPFAARSIDAELVSRSFHLTASEARVAIQLAQGLRLDSIARNNGVAVATVRTQLKSLFSKTGTNRQSDLVRLVSGIPEIVAPQRPSSAHADERSP